MLALQADTQHEWAINANQEPSISTNWVDCGSYASSVVSVNGATGAITIDLASLNGVPKTTTVNNKALSSNVVLTLGDIITLNNNANYYVGGDGALHQLASNISVADNSASGYFDIGTIRIQWGHTTGTSITFPAAFKDTNYSFSPTVILNNTQTLTSVFVLTKSTSGVSIQKSWYNGGSWGTSLSSTVDWMAIGLKP